MQSLQPSQVSSRSYLEIKQRQHGMSQFLGQNNNNNHNKTISNNNSNNFNATTSANSNTRCSSQAAGDRKGSLSQKALSISQKPQNISQQDQSYNQLQSFNSCTDNKENVSFQANSHQSGHSRTFNYETSFQSNSLYESLKPNRQNNNNNNNNMKKGILSMMDGCSQVCYDQEIKDNPEQFNSISLQGQYQAGNIDQHQQIYPCIDTRAIKKTTNIENIQNQRKNQNQQSSQLTNPSCISTNNNSIFTHKNSLQNTTSSHSNSIITQYDRNRSISQLKQPKQQNINLVEQLLFHNTTGMIHPQNENTINPSGTAAQINSRTLNPRKQQQNHNSQPLLSSLINEDSMHAENMIENYLERVFSCSIQSGENNESLLLSEHKEQQDDQGINRLLFSQVDSEVHHPFRSLREPSIDETDNDRPLPQIIFETNKGLSSPMADLKNEDKEQHNNEEYSELKKQILLAESQRNESLMLLHQALKSKTEIEEQLRQAQNIIQEISSNEKKVIFELNQAIQAKNAQIKEKELAIDEKNDILVKKMEIEKNMLQLEKRIEQVEKDKKLALDERNQAMENENIAVEQKNNLVQEKEKVVLEKNAIMEKLESALAQIDQVLKEKEDAMNEKNIAIQERDAAIQEKDSSARQLTKEIEAKQALIILNQQCEAKINGQVHQLEQLYLRNGQLEQQASEGRDKHEHEVKDLESQINQVKQLNSQLQSLSEVATSQARVLTTHNQQLQGQLKEFKQNLLRDSAKDGNGFAGQITMSYKQAFTEVITNALTALDLISQKISNYQVTVKSSSSQNQIAPDVSLLSEQLMEQVFMGIQHIAQCFLQFTALNDSYSEISPSFQQAESEEHLEDLDNVQTASFGRDQEVKKKKQQQQQQSQYQHDQMMRMQWDSEHNNNYQPNFYKEGKKTNHM